MSPVKDGALIQTTPKALQMDSNIGISNPQRFPRRPLLVFVGILLVTLLLGNMLFDSLREAIRLDAQEDIAAVGTLKANQIRAWLDERYAESRILADNSFFAREVALWMHAGAPDDARRRQLTRRFEAFLNVHHYQAVVLCDASGRVILSAGERVWDEKTQGGTACAVATSGQFRFIDLHRRQDGQHTRLGFTSPLLEGARCIGSIYLAEDPDRFLFPLIDGWPSASETAETELVRIDGERVQYLNQLRHRTEFPLGFSLPLDTPGLAAALALRGKSGLLQDAQDYRGLPVLAFATPIRDTPWVLIAKIDEDEAYRMVEQVRRVAGVLTVLVFALLGIGFWQWRRSDLAEAEAAILKERMRADALRTEGEKRFRTVFEHTALPMARNSLTGEFVEVNEAWCRMFGYSREEVSSRHLDWQQLTHPDDIEPGASLVRRMLAGEIEDFSIEKRYLHQGGKILWGSVQAKLVRDECGKPEFIIRAIQDITERKLTEMTINFMAYHDKLTGLPNRALLFDRLSQAISQAKRDGRHVALLFVDLDGFKTVNDRYGHEAGDSVLKMAAQRFLACVRAVDTVARFGGDEFAIILGNLDGPQQARGVAEKIVQAFVQGMVLPDGNECSVGASVGISIYPEHGTAMDNLITAADQAMYQSKRSGKSTYTLFAERSPHADDYQWLKLDDSHLMGVAEMDEQHRNLAYLVNRLNAALQRDESSESVLQLMDELLVAARHHFETENRYMAQYHYPGQAEHEIEHAQLMNEALRFKKQFEEGRELLVLQSIKDWLLSHILYTDKRLADYLLQHGAK